MKFPFHADHIGSLLRPESLQEAQKKTADGSASPADLLKAQHESIAHIVKREQEVGVTTISDGEFSRRNYIAGWFEKLEGFTEVEDPPWEMYRLSAPPIAFLKKTGQKFILTVVCTSKIKYNQSPYLETWKYLRSLVPQEKWGECKFTMPPACFFHLRLAPGRVYEKGVYDNDEEFFSDLAKAYQQEFKTLHSEGLQSIQIDDPTLAYFCSQEMLDGLKKEGVDSDALFDLYLKAHNQCLEGRPEGLHVGLHICRGNFSKAMHFSEGSYEAIAEKFFKILNYDTFYLEYDSPRAGGFEPLRFLPKGKNVVLGVITTKDPTLEDPELMKKRVLEAADIIAKGQGTSREDAMERIGISPQCGFASTGIGAEAMTEDKMFAKLKLVKDVAKELWPDRP